MDFSLERTFGEKRPVKYCLTEGELPALLVVFSASGGGYNYTRYLSEINCHKLFVQDDYGYNGEGTWYLGEDNDYELENSVHQLIQYQVNYFHLTKEKVILCGSSMGGFASLYFGLKYGYKYIVSGAPQIFLYSYFKNRPELLYKITGLPYEDPLNKKLEYIITDLEFNEGQKTFLFVGEMDSHLPYQIEPYLSAIELKSKDIKLKLLPGGHNIGHTFGEEFQACIKDILTEI